MCLVTKALPRCVSCINCSYNRINVSYIGSVICILQMISKFNMVILNLTMVSGSACNNIIKVCFLPAKISRKCEKLKFCLLVVFALNFQLIDLVIRFGGNYINIVL